MRMERELRERLEVRIVAFEQWREAELRRVTDEYLVLTRQAALSASVLKTYPDCGPAWDALAAFYHRQAALTADLDRLSCAKLSDFLEAPYMIEQLFREWRSRVDAA
jgi:GTP1/Obg family GTP-binding protein